MFICIIFLNDLKILIFLFNKIFTSRNEFILSLRNYYIIISQCDY